MTGFSVVVFGLRFTVAADDEGILRVLEHYVLPWAPRQRGSHSAGGLVFRVLRDGGGECYRLFREDKLLAAGARMPGLFTALQWALDEAILRRLRGYAVIHAGVAVWRGRAILLPGTSGAGKTTLVRELLNRGAEYCSDEYAVIDASGLVHPWPRPLMMRDANGEQRPVRAAELGAEVRGEPAPAGLLLFLRHGQGARFAVEQIDRSEAWLRLMENTPQILAEKPEIAAPLKRACSSGACFAGTRGDAAEAAVRILELAEEA